MKKNINIILLFLFVFANYFITLELSGYELLKTKKGYEVKYEEYELTIFDLGWRLKFREVKAGSVLKFNPSFLPNGIKNSIVQRIIRNSNSPDFNLNIHHVKKMYFASVEEKKNSLNRLSYTVYVLDDFKYTKQLVEYHDPLHRRPQKRNVTLFFNEKILIVIEVNPQADVKVFSKFFKWLNKKFNAYNMAKY